MGGAHLQCVKNHHVKYEYKGMNTVGVADYTNWNPLSISDVKMSKFNTTQKHTRNYETCTK